MKKRFKRIAVAAIAVCFGSVVLLFVRNQTAEQVSVNSVERKDVENTISIKGTIRGRDLVKIYSENGKKVCSVKVTEGEKVRKGDVLCELQNICDENSIEQAGLLVKDAERELANIKELHELGAATEYDLRSAESALKQAELNLEMVRGGNSILESPISGTVTRVNTRDGKIPLSTDILFVIEDLSELQMELLVSDDEIGQVKTGQSVRITTPVQEEYVYGKVEKIALTGEESASGSSDMVIPVTVILENSDKKVMAGVSGEAEIIIESCSDALSVPVQALSEEADGTWIYLVKDNTLKKKRVSVLAEGEKYAAIADDPGILEGDQVVLMPADGYTDGMRVKLR